MQSQKDPPFNWRFLSGKKDLPLHPIESTLLNHRTVIEHSPHQDFIRLSQAERGSRFHGSPLYLEHRIFLIDLQKVVSFFFHKYCMYDNSIICMFLKDLWLFLIFFW